MFNRKKRKHIGASSIIGHETRILGDVTFEGRLHINGTVRGNVTAERDDKAVLTLSESGSIEGNVQVPYVVLNGPVKGSVFAKDHVELASKARVEGDVHYVLIEMAMGAEVNGKLVRISTEDPVPLVLSAPLREAPQP
ncbi:MAG: polymer-forming cytoskeletal protein [Gammaproteobacteria bacterium]